jgi:hypothetical protein
VGLLTEVCGIDSKHLHISCILDVGVQSDLEAYLLSLTANCRTVCQAEFPWG